MLRQDWRTVCGQLSDAGERELVRWAGPSATSCREAVVQPSPAQRRYWKALDAGTISGGAAAGLDRVGVSILYTLGGVSRRAVGATQRGLTGGYRVTEAPVRRG